MNKYTIGVFAHANAGKTTLTEHLLVKAGVISNAGRVDAGNTVTDNLSVEKSRGITVRSSLISFQSEDNLFYLIDTPGHIDFVSEVERAMSVLDLAILVISGVERVEAQTYDIFNTLVNNKIPTIIFVNKLDRAGADLNLAIQEIKKEFGVETIQLNDFCKDKVQEKQLKDIAEQLSNVDDEILKIFVNNSLTKKNVEKSLLQNFKDLKCYPVFCGTALNDIGVDEIYNFLGKVFVERQTTSELSLFVYQTRVDGSTQNCYVKNYGKPLKTKDIIEIEDYKFKLDNIFIPKGNILEKTDILDCGDVAIIKALEFSSGTWIGKKTRETTLNFQKPLFSISIKPKDESKKIELANALKILNIEDKNLNLSFNEMLKVLQVDIMGKVQAEILEQFLKERFDIETEISPLNLIYKEQPIKTGTGTCSYTSCSAVEFCVRPLEKGSGIVYKNSDNVVGKMLKSYQKQIERLVKENLKNTPYGWELTDAEITLVNARYDSVASKPMHFNICVPIAMMRTLQNCETKLLEPINEVVIIVPENISMTLNNYLKNMNFVIENVENSDGKVKYFCVIPAKLNEKVKMDITKFCGGLAKFYTHFKEYSQSLDSCENLNRNADTRNEVLFVQNFMNGNIKLLDKEKKHKAKGKFSQRKFDKDDI